MLTIVIAILLRLTIGVFSKAENWGRFYDPHSRPIVFEKITFFVRILATDRQTNKHWTAAMLKAATSLSRATA